MMSPKRRTSLFTMSMHVPSEMAKCPCIELQDGNKVPLVGLGTAQMFDDIAQASVTCALDAGYRLIDTAAYYDNEIAIGKALKEKFLSSSLRREDVFVTTKLWNTNHGVENVRRACERSLRRLGLSYIDLYLVHWPMGFAHSEEEFKGGDSAADETWSYNQGDFLRDFRTAQPVDSTPLEDTWKEMEKLVDAGLVKSLGLANFNRPQIERILKICRIRPQMLQVEMSLHFMNRDLVDFAKSVGIQVTGYSTLGSPGLAGGAPCPMNEPHVKEIALKHHKMPSQVLIRHMLQLGICTIPKSINPKRILENFDVFDFELTAEEMETLSTCGRNERLFKALSWRSHPEYPFTEVASK